MANVSTPFVVKGLAGTGCSGCAFCKVHVGSAAFESMGLGFDWAAIPCLCRRAGAKAH